MVLGILGSGSGSNMQAILDAIDAGELQAEIRGESVDRTRHTPAVEIKGATFTELAVRQQADGRWLAQCVVDV